MTTSSIIEKHLPEILNQTNIHSLVYCSGMTKRMLERHIYDTIEYMKYVQSVKEHLVSCSQLSSAIFVHQNRLYRKPFPKGYGFTWEGYDKNVALWQS